MSAIHLLQNDGTWHDWSDLTPLSLNPDGQRPTVGHRPYRLYRFLTEVEDILLTIDDPATQLAQIIPLVQQLLEQSPWFYFNPLTPDPDTGWAIETLYDEPEFPLTLQLVAWAPGSTSPVHNHGCWAIVALLQGTEINHVWHRSPTDDHPDRLTPAPSQTLTSGDILGILPDAIHQIAAQGDRPTISFNLYGPTNYGDRYEFDRAAHTAHNF
jgi:predicted metal-dependent enzyme (double-stranded beta helix superfamily)